MVGLAIAFPIALGLSIVAGTAMAYLVSPRGDPALLFSGVGLVLVAVVFNSLAYRARGKTSSTASIKHLLVCISSGVLLSGFTPLLAKSFTDRAPLSPYGAGVLFTLGALVSTVPIMSWLFQHPMQGQALTSADYFASSPREHAAGFLGGAVWGLGTVVTFAAANYVGVALAGAIGQANSLVAALWGVFVWKEFRGAPAMSRILLGFMFVLYLAGIAMLAGSHR
jgi:glucose uptake protein